MKKLIVILVFFTSTNWVSAQDLATSNREKLKPLGSLIGNWKGTATIQQQGKAPLQVNQEERITWQLDSLLVNIEGIGNDPATGKKNFHAFALVYFNPATQQIAMKSFTMEGTQTDAYFKIMGDDQFEWGFDIPNNRGKIKYSITISQADRKWKETGEYSPDGTKWYSYMSMELTKQ